MSKKVVIVIVEGPSEEELLIDRLKELYSGQEIRFRIMTGDIFYNLEKQIKIKSEIGDIVKSFINKNKFRSSDILAVLQIVDTDGCFITNDCISIYPDQKKSTIYCDDMICVNSKRQKENIELRNNVRSRNLRLVNNLKSIISNKYKYQIYYFSRNLEHVLFDDSNPKDINKLKNIENFTTRLNEPIEGFLKLFLPDFSENLYEGKYKESWDYIDTGTNSLKRFNSIPLMFDFIDMQLNI